MRKKFLSLVLVLCMVLSMLPITAGADDAQPPAGVDTSGHNGVKWKVVTANLYDQSGYFKGTELTSSYTVQKDQHLSGKVTLDTDDEFDIEGYEIVAEDLYGHYNADDPKAFGYWTGFIVCPTGETTEVTDTFKGLLRKGAVIKDTEPATIKAALEQQEWMLEKPDWGGKYADLVDGNEGARMYVGAGQKYALAVRVLTNTTETAFFTNTIDQKIFVLEPVIKNQKRLAIDDTTTNVTLSEVTDAQVVISEPEAHNVNDPTPVSETMKIMVPGGNITDGDYNLKFATTDGKDHFAVLTVAEGKVTKVSNTTYSEAASDLKILGPKVGTDTTLFMAKYDISIEKADGPYFMTDTVTMTGANTGYVKLSDVTAATQSTKFKVYSGAMPAEATNCTAKVQTDNKTVDLEFGIAPTGEDSTNYFITIDPQGNGSESKYRTPVKAYAYDASAVRPSDVTFQSTKGIKTVEKTDLSSDLTAPVAVVLSDVTAPYKASISGKDMVIKSVTYGDGQDGSKEIPVTSLPLNVLVTVQDKDAKNEATYAFVLQKEGEVGGTASGTVQLDYKGAPSGEITIELKGASFKESKEYSSTSASGISVTMTGTLGWTLTTKANSNTATLKFTGTDSAYDATQKVSIHIPQSILNNATDQVNVEDITIQKVTGIDSSDQDKIKEAAAAITPKDQVDVADEADAKKIVEDAIKAVELSEGVKPTVSFGAYTAPVAGTKTNKAGKDGTLPYSVVLAKDGNQDIYINDLLLTITATKYDTYTVTYGDTDLRPDTVVAGQTTVAPSPEPEHPENPDWYDFGGWMTEKDGDEEFDFNKPIITETTIWAKWNRKPVELEFATQIGTKTVTDIPVKLELQDSEDIHPSDTTKPIEFPTDTTMTIRMGSTPAFSVAPDEGYSIDKVEIEKTEVKAPSDETAEVKIYTVETPVVKDSKITITLSEADPEVTLDNEALKIPAGSTNTVTATIAPLDASKYNIEWKSSDESVATVTADTTAPEKAVVTGVSETTTPITLTCTVTSKAQPEKNKSVTCTVEVLAAGSNAVNVTPTSKTVPIDTEGNATVELEATSSDASTTYTWTTDPTDMDGATIELSSKDEAKTTLTVKKKDVSKTQSAAGTITVTVEGKGSDGKTGKATCTVTITDEDQDKVTEKVGKIETKAEIAQADLNNPEDIKGSIQTYLAALYESEDIASKDCMVMISQEPEAGSQEKPNGTDGSFSYQVYIEVGASHATVEGTGKITATPYSKEAQEMDTALGLIEAKPSYTLSSKEGEDEDSIKKALVEDINDRLKAGGSKLTIQEANIDILEKTDPDSDAGKDGTLSFKVTLDDPDKTVTITDAKISFYKTDAAPTATVEKDTETGKSNATAAVSMSDITLPAATEITEPLKLPVTITPEVKGEADVVNVAIPVDIAEKLANEDITSETKIDTEVGGMTISAAQMKDINAEVSGSDYTVISTEKKAPEDITNEKLPELTPDNGFYAATDFSVKTAAKDENGDAKVEAPKPVRFREKIKAYIKIARDITIKNWKDLAVVYVPNNNDDPQSIDIIGYDEDARTISFYTDHFSTYMVTTKAFAEENSTPAQLELDPVQSGSSKMYNVSIENVSPNTTYVALITGGNGTDTEFSIWSTTNSDSEGRNAFFSMKDGYTIRAWKLKESGAPSFVTVNNADSLLLATTAVETPIYTLQNGKLNVKE